jgi:copper homeostasis protein (lipoprotein)
MNFRHAPALASLALIGLLGACSEPAAPDAARVETTPVAADAPAPIAPVAAPAALDVRAFAGTFAGILPCAACEGIDSRVELHADGTFRLVETYQGQADGGPFEITGTWTAENAGKQILLDPDSKSEPDHRYDIVSPDEIRMLDLEGKATLSGQNSSLRRQAAPTP